MLFLKVSGPLFWGQFIALIVYAALFVAGIVVKSKRLDAFAAVVFLLGLLGFLESLVRVGVVKA